MMEGLKNLQRMIQKASTKYSSEFIWQDVRLTEEFKSLYQSYLEKNGYSIDFFESSAVITSTSGKYIFVPNQWFVIASYPVGLCCELFRYKDILRDLSDKLGEKFDAYIKHLRDETTVSDREKFMANIKDVASDYVGVENADDAAKKLWRFATDYSWWSGQKTIDRGDFFISVILNMLNLVNASQSYVADIVDAYVSSPELKSLVRRIDAFTVDLQCNEIWDDIDSEEPIEDSTDKSIVSPAPVRVEESTLKKGSIRIKLSSDKKTKIIKMNQ